MNIINKGLRKIFRESPSSHRTLPFYVRIGRKIKPSSFTDASILKIIWVDPHKIDIADDVPAYYGHISRDINENTQDNFLKTRVNSVEKHFKDNEPWESTNYFNSWPNKAKDRRSRTSSNDMFEEYIFKRLQRIDELYEIIASNNYKTQWELYESDRKEVIRKCNDAPHPLLNEIGVSIDKTGTMLFARSGIHRLGIARALSLSEVPVQIRTRHRGWQDIRERILMETDTEVMDTCSEHPDIQDIL